MPKRWTAHESAIKYDAKNRNHKRHWKTKETTWSQKQISLERVPCHAVASHIFLFRRWNRIQSMQQTYSVYIMTPQAHLKTKRTLLKMFCQNTNLWHRKRPKFMKHAKTPFANEKYLSYSLFVNFARALSVQCTSLRNCVQFSRWKILRTAITAAKYASKPNHKSKKRPAGILFLPHVLASIFPRHQKQSILTKITCQAFEGVGMPLIGDRSHRPIFQPIRNIHWIGIFWSEISLLGKKLSGQKVTKSSSLKRHTGTPLVREIDNHKAVSWCDLQTLCVSSLSCP